MGFQSHASLLAIFFSLALISSMVITIQARVGIGLVRAPPPPTLTPPPPPPPVTGTVGGCVPCWGDKKGRFYVFIKIVC